ncbi:thioredoxin family protein [Oceanispirochaeta sp. M1]|uniref:thioredoxin family protein n=2 Tax=unclassified Oceanispirochaeta TaxID=2635722 RepID=UPI000E09DA18|nr:thioredoxin family protein [Oceanispirochaeta sp. M1]MBF9014294.1 thioredoxin family protein [Oceanispirochaeta sp. M2]NPD71180.1 thioredoxin family protein [Oceanispirochaeta sp. M1]RDG33570.1 thioredoxin [Oceanispirochaeta sp. M1]
MNILSTIVIVIALYFGFQYFMIFKMKQKKGKAAPELSGSYGKAVKNSKTSLFYFYSPSCGACRSMTPLVEDYTKNNPRCFKVDVSKDMETARAFGIMGTPSTVLVENGLITDFIVGPKPAGDFTRLLEMTRS